MPNEQEPVVLELAPLPREKIGPFLLLGLEKDAGAEAIEANWAQRVIWARRNRTSVPLENINWAREVLKDADRRLRADVTSLNPDVLDRTVRRLERHYGTADPQGPPGDEQELAAYVPAMAVPDSAAVRTAVPMPAVPTGVPGVTELVRRLVQEPPDPWAIELPADPEQDPPHE